MAAGFLAREGTEFGPCAGACEHRDCAANRRMAATSCVHCGDPIGYDRGFFDVTPSDVDAKRSKLAHASCEYAEAEAARQAI